MVLSCESESANMRPSSSEDGGCQPLPCEAHAKYRDARRLGQRHLAPEVLQMRGHDGPSEGLWPLWRVKLDLKRDPDSCQHATQHKYFDHCHCFWARRR